MFRAIFDFITGFLDFIKKYFFILLFMALAIGYFLRSDKEELSKPNLMRIDIVGPIVSSSDFLKRIKEAEDSNIKGVLVYIDSPGGLVAPSVEMSLAIKRLHQKKPVVVYAAGVMASGSYYAGIWADKIIANPGAIVGSIGVIYDGFDLEGLASKLGVKEQVLKAGKYKEAGTFTRAWTEDEKAELNQVLQDTYNRFVFDVAKARGLKIEDKDKFADAHIFSASRAKMVGLVDGIGSIYDAKQAIIQDSAVVVPKWKEKDKYEKYLDKFLDGVFSKISVYVSGLKSSL
ncbi:MAG: signal peptide peptidase SppA [Epsilonproteobacteria bacterium]|nr:signal peptide peptidase SppA [Campylobacterota bacterium]